MFVEKLKTQWIAILFLYPAALLIAQNAPVAASPKGPELIILTIRDSTTGYAVQAEVSFTKADSDKKIPTVAHADNQGHLRMELPPGRYRVRVTAPGFEPMEISWNTPASVQDAKLGVMLVSKTQPEELRPEVLDPKLRDGYVLMQGYVVDADTGMPLSGVQVRLEKLGMVAITNDRGYFSQSVRFPTLPPNALGFEDNLTFELPGYATYAFTNELITNTPWALYQIDLQRGSGVDRHNATHHLLRGRNE